MTRPAKFWRLPCSHDEDERPPNEIVLPSALARRPSSPRCGHGVTLATYEASERIALLKWLGIVIVEVDIARIVEWRPSDARIRVETRLEHDKWNDGAFGFAQSTITRHGLHELWGEAFSGIER